MRKLLLLMLLLSGTAGAGDYYDARINTYDPVSGLYYTAIENRVEREGFLSSKSYASRIVNINIFDPASNQSKLLFSAPQPEGIAVVLFETGFKDGSLQFNGSSASGTVLNNQDIAQREPRDKLLVGVWEKKSLLLFVTNRRGENMQRLTTVPAGADWHLDIKNAKLRIVHPLTNSVRIESHDW